MPASAKQQLLALAACGRPWAENSAQMALLAQSQRLRGDITEVDFKSKIKELGDVEGDDPGTLKVLQAALAGLIKDKS